MTPDDSTTRQGREVEAGPAPRPGPASVTGPAVHRALGETSRAAIMALLREHPDGTDTGRIAAVTGLHPNTVRHHVDVLIAAGLVRARPDPTRTGGRPRRLFQSTHLAGGPDGDGYPLLAEIMVKQLAGSRNGAERAIAAGRAWSRDRTSAGPAPPGTGAGSTFDAADAILTLFAEVGFQPQLVPRPDVWQILLHHCPFIALARAHPDIVCGVHLGLIHGALARHHLPPTDGQLVPFVGPTLCIATLPRTAGRR